jgi:ectoine hydrolase
MVDNAVNHPMEFFAQELTRRGLDRKAIGTDREAYGFTNRCRDVLQAALPNARFVEAPRLTNWLRLVKSDAEIVVMGQAARITENMMRTFFAAVEPGLRECDVMGEILKAQASGTKDFGGGYSCIVPMMPTGEGTATPHMTWSDRPFRKGEAAYLEAAGVRHRYHAPMVRALHLGPAPKQFVDTSKAVSEGIEAALAAARPGNTCEDVEAAWRKSIARYSIEKASRIGYSIGIGYPPDWGEHTASLRQHDKTVLQPNMAMHMVCGIWDQDWGGVSISEPFHVTAKGAVLFANVPRDLQIKH